jgi:hypothetical protein
MPGIDVFSERKLNPPLKTAAFLLPRRAQPTRQLEMTACFVSRLLNPRLDCETVTFPSYVSVLDEVSCPLPNFQSACG